MLRLRVRASERQAERQAPQCELFGMRTTASKEGSNRIAVPSKALLRPSAQHGSTDCPKAVRQGDDERSESGASVPAKGAGLQPDMSRPTHHSLCRRRRDGTRTVMGPLGQDTAHVGRTAAAPYRLVAGRRPSIVLPSFPVNLSKKHQGPLRLLQRPRRNLMTKGISQCGKSNQRYRACSCSCGKRCAPWASWPGCAWCIGETRSRQLVKGRTGGVRPRTPRTPRMSSPTRLRVRSVFLLAEAKVLGWGKRSLRPSERTVGRCTGRVV